MIQAPPHRMSNNLKYNIQEKLKLKKEEEERVVIGSPGEHLIGQSSPDEGGNSLIWSWESKSHDWAKR